MSYEDFLKATIYYTADLFDQEIDEWQLFTETCREGYLYGLQMCEGLSAEEIKGLLDLVDSYENDFMNMDLDHSEIYWYDAMQYAVYHVADAISMYVMNHGEPTLDITMPSDFGRYVWDQVYKDETKTQG